MVFGQKNVNCGLNITIITLAWKILGKKTWKKEKKQYKGIIIAEPSAKRYKMLIL